MSCRDQSWTTTHQESFIKLKQAGELFEQLVNAVQPLQEDGTLLAHVIHVLLVAAPVPEFMAKVQPLCLHKHLKTLLIKKLIKRLSNRDNSLLSPHDASYEQ